MIRAEWTYSDGHRESVDMTSDELREWIAVAIATGGHVSPWMEIWPDFMDMCDEALPRLEAALGLDGAS